MNAPQQMIAELGGSLSEVTILLHQAIAERAGLSGTDHKYLGMLQRHGAMTAGELARRTGLTTGAVTGLIDRLAAKGLLHREFDPEDRRKVRIVPNEAQIDALLGPSSALLRGRVVEYVARMPDAEATIVARYLKDMVALLASVTEEIRQSNTPPTPLP